MALFGALPVHDLLGLADPLTLLGHLIALVIGVGLWPLVRRRHVASAR
ncbi:hypothetical protein [Streptomyces sp. bgisy027]